MKRQVLGENPVGRSTGFQFTRSDPHSHHSLGPQFPKQTILMQPCIQLFGEHAKVLDAALQAKDVAKKTRWLSQALQLHPGKDEDNKQVK